MRTYAAKYPEDVAGLVLVDSTAATGEEMSGVVAEHGVASRSADEAGSLRTLDAKPLVVLTAERGNSEGWMASQDRTVTLSTNSLHRVVPGATHAAFVDDPVHAAAVTRAIHDVVVSVRTGRRSLARGSTSYVPCT